MPPNGEGTWPPPPPATGAIRHGDPTSVSLADRGGYVLAPVLATRQARLNSAETDFFPLPFASFASVGSVRSEQVDTFQGKADDARRNVSRRVLNSSLSRSNSSSSTDSRLPRLVPPVESVEIARARPGPARPDTTRSLARFATNRLVWSTCFGFIRLINARPDQSTTSRRAARVIRFYKFLAVPPCARTRGLVYSGRVPFQASVLLAREATPVRSWACVARGSFDSVGYTPQAGSVRCRGEQVTQSQAGNMRNSTLLKWAQNSANSKNQTSKNGTSRNWIHPSDALQKGHIAYLVKYLGSTEVDQPKGIEVVKEAICKLKFNQQLRKSEGTKTPKVELTISIDGVAIQEPKTKTSPKRIMHQYPLHRISYCADDKGEKKFFSFIAKEEDAERHTCFVFVSDKLAEEITLTIGQAFDLAYRRFLETSGKDLEAQRRCMVLQQKIKRLEHENNVYRQRLQDIAAIKGSADVSAYLSQHNLPDILHVPGASNETTQVNGTSSKPSSLGSNSDANGNTSNGSQQPPPPVPPRSFEKTFDDNFLGSEPAATPSVGTKLEGLLMDEFEEDFNPRAYESAANGLANHQTNHSCSLLNGQLSSNSNFFAQSNGTTSPPPLLAPPPKAKDSRRQNGVKEDLFGSIPFNPTPSVNAKSEFNDPFEMGEFGAPTAIFNPSQQELENAIGLLDKKLLEMKDGFSRGLAIDTDDFSLESLDPLRN